MKKILLFVIIFGVAAIILRADFYVKQKTHTDSFYRGGVMNPAVDREDEYWITENRIAFRGENRIIILDKNKKKILFVNNTNKSFFEASLPLETEKLLSEQVVSILKIYQFKIAIEETKEIKKFSNWKCRRYNMKDWMMRGGVSFNDRESIILATTDVPFNLDLIYELRNTIFKLLKPDDDFFKEVNKIKGLEVSVESVRYSDGLGIKSWRKILEVTEKNPAEKVYEVPEGYTKKEKLSLPDLQSFLN